jgi:hypothetical protein
MADEPMDVEGEEADDDSKAMSAKWEKVHEAALDEYERDWERERGNQDEAYEDLKFRRGRQEDQWTPEAINQRRGRPCHTINLLPKFIRQVTGDMRKMRPSIKAVPVDSNGDPETADVLSGMFRYIENRSYAKHVYTTAADSQVCAGIGHWQVTTEYASSTTFNQELRIMGIEDGVAVLWDADSVMPTREDAMHCFVPMDMTLSAFKKRWPDAKADGFDIRTSAAFTDWLSDDYIRVVTYWKKEPVNRTLALMPDGSIDDLTDQVKDLPKDQLQAGLDWLAQNKGARIEERDGYKVCRYLMTQGEVLEEYEWKGMHIPIIPAVGEEVRIGREVYRHGIVRYARDLQRMVNYYASAETEVVALQPKAPWIVTKAMVEKYYDQWENANTDNLPFLEFDVDTKAPGRAPERIQPPVASQAIQLGGTKAAEDMKAVIGIYDANLGAKSNETSGVAIARRDAQADTGTFVYLDNFNMAIQRTGQIVMDLIPHIYDAQRMIQIIGDDGKPALKEINKPTVTDGIDRVQYDVTTGSYDVMIEQGPGYATKREQAADAMAAFIQAFPAAAPLIGDIYAKVQDWPHADEIGERLEQALPPEIKNKLQEDRAKASQAPGEPPPPPTPQQQQDAMAAQMKTKAAELELQGKELDNEKKKADIAKTLKDAGQLPQGDPAASQQAQVDAHLQAIDVAAKEDELRTKRALNALTIQIKQAELEKARIGLVATGEKHTLDTVAGLQDLSHTADRHEAGMTSQVQNFMHGSEKHRASMDRMTAPPDQAGA